MSTNGFSAAARLAGMALETDDVPQKRQLKRCEGFLAVPRNAMSISRKHGPFALAVYLSYLFHRNSDTGVAFLSAKTIAREAGMSLRAVKKYLPKLQPDWLYCIGTIGRCKAYVVRSAFTPRMSASDAREKMHHKHTNYKCATSITLPDWVYHEQPDMHRN